jgi:hypothetical protein
MNEKIKELAKEHLITSEYTECGSQECRKYEFHPEELEEFVQLIIQECANVCKTGGVSNIDYNTGRLHCVYDIIRHFGIE